MRVQLTRKDEMAWENYGLAFVIDQRVGLDAEGQIVAWDSRGVVADARRPARRRHAPGTSSPASWPASSRPPFAPRSPAPEPAGAFDNGSNAAPSYVAGCVGDGCGGTGAVKSERVLTHAVKSPFWTGPLRSPQRLQNTFAHECFMDEVAARGQGRSAWPTGCGTCAIRGCATC